ncbi:MAG: copper resistance protein CopC [Chloroflexi bacterium]|nr:copper resistance protein CopC [Chloroflexota bacterium]
MRRASWFLVSGFWWGRRAPSARDRSPQTRNPKPETRNPFRGPALLRGLVLGLVMVVVGHGLALAHANLVRSEPEANAVLDAAPGELRLWFSEAVELRFCEVHLLDREGRRLELVGPLRADPADAGAVRAPLPPLPPGVYTVVWRALSAVDGHVTAGTFAFAVGRDEVPAGGLRPSARGPGAESAGGPAPAAVAARWLGYLGMAILAGGFGFVPLVLLPAMAEPRTPAPKRPRATPAGRLAAPAEAGEAAIPPLPSGLVVLLIGGAGLASAASLVGAVLQAAASAGVDPLAALGAPLAALLGGTRYGLIFWARLLLLALLGVLVRLLWVRMRRARPVHGRWWWWCGLVLSSLALLTVSLGSHAAAGASAPVAVAIDWLHLVAASLWIGGLGALLVVLRQAGAAREGDEGDPGPAPLRGSAVHWTLPSTDRLGRANPVPGLVARFSRVATAGVATVVLSGIYRAVAEVGDWANLLDTPYGTALLAKTALIVPLLGLAGVSFLATRRETRKIGESGRGEAGEPLRRHLRRTVGAEALLATAVLAAAAVLTSLPPARDAFGPGLILRGQAADLRVVVAVNPGQPAFNTFDVYLRDGAGRPVAGAQKVALIFTMVEHEMGEAEAVAGDLGDGRYLAQGLYTSMSGTWRVEVLVRRSGQDDVRTTLALPIGSRRSGDSGRAAADSALLVAAPLAVGVGALALGLAAVVRTLRMGRARGSRGRAIVAVGCVLALLGSGLSVRALLAPSSPAAADLVNPYPPTEESLARGRQLYQQECATCHGPGGQGDGPLAATLRPRPADLSQHVGTHADGELYGWITGGLPGTAMPAFKDRLTDADRWHVLNYVKTFAPVDR